MQTSNTLDFVYKSSAINTKKHHFVTAVLEYLNIPHVFPELVNLNYSPIKWTDRQMLAIYRPTIYIPLGVLSAYHTLLTYFSNEIHSNISVILRVSNP